MTGVGRNTNREFTGCDILSPLKELCPQSLRRSSRCGCRVSEQMRVLLLHLVFAFPGILGTSFRIPTDLHDWNATLLQTLNFAVHNLNWFFNEMELFINVDFVQWNRERLSDKHFSKVSRRERDTMNTAQVSLLISRYEPFPPWREF
ncbi:hypothetical protein Tco_0889757 [Tanacetum coccineum]